MTISYKVEIEINEEEKHFDLMVDLYAETEPSGRYGDFDRFICWVPDDIHGNFKDSEKEEILDYLQNDGYDDLNAYIEEL